MTTPIGACPAHRQTLTPPIVSTWCTFTAGHSGDHSFGPGLMTGEVELATTTTPLIDEAVRLASELATLRRKVSNIADAAEQAEKHMLACPVGVSPELAELADVLSTIAKGLRGVLALPQTGGNR